MLFKGKFVMLMSCSRCNVKCKHCYISYKNDFSPEELKDIAYNLSKKYNIMINGAEPLVDLRYLNSYPIVNQKHILTNGLALINNYDETIKNFKKMVLIIYLFHIILICMTSFQVLIKSNWKNYLERLFWMDLN